MKQAAGENFSSQTSRIEAQAEHSNIVFEQHDPLVTMAAQKTMSVHQHHVHQCL